MKKYKIPVSCNKDCGGGCPLLAHVEDGRLIKITDNPLGTRYTTGCVRDGEKVMVSNPRAG